MKDRKVWPIRFDALYKISHEHAGDRSVRHSISGVTRHHVDILVSRISANKSKAVGRLHDLTGPSNLGFPRHGKALPRLRFEPIESFVCVVS